jgi:hypothetical protein
MVDDGSQIGERSFADLNTALTNTGLTAVAACDDDVAIRSLVNFLKSSSEYFFFIQIE